MNITSGGLDDPRVQVLIAHHFHTARMQTDLSSAHALDLHGLRGADIWFWSVWEGDQVIGIGALKRLSEAEGEIKSMHTSLTQRRKGVGSALLNHIVGVAGQLGMSRLNLETGIQPYFEPALALYRRYGFVECPPFGDYVADPNSVFMTLELG